MNSIEFDFCELGRLIYHFDSILCISDEPETIFCNFYLRRIRFGKSNQFSLRSFHSRLAIYKLGSRVTFEISF